MGLTLRRAWFLNGCIFNSEVWSGYSDYSDNGHEELKIIDHKIMRLIMKAQTKLSIEMLYLETAEISLQHVISVRRLMYYQTVIKRHMKELTNRTFNVMKQNTLIGDWTKLLVNYLENISSILQEEEEIKSYVQE